MPPEFQAPALAVYKSIKLYVPKYGDFIVWCGWFRTWYGLIIDYDVNSNQVSIAFEGTPQLLLTMNSDEIEKNIHRFNLEFIRNQKKGRWYAQQISGQVIWYI